ncbi:TPA: hypothetical protein QH957_002287 [Enterobacter bugandensis]|nr:hypothetical protein [Enterobacter bugandensis]
MAKQSKSTRAAGEVKAAYAEHFKAGQSPQPTDFAQLIDDSFCAHELLDKRPAEVHQGLGWQPNDKIHVVTTGGIDTDADDALAVNISPRMKIDETNENLDGKQWFGVEDFYSLSRWERNELGAMLGYNLIKTYRLQLPAVHLYSCMNKGRVFIESTDDTGPKLTLQAYFIDLENHYKTNYLYTVITEDYNDAVNIFPLQRLPSSNGDHFILKFYETETNLAFKYCTLSVLNETIEKKYITKNFRKTFFPNNCKWAISQFPMADYDFLLIWYTEDFWIDTLKIKLNEFQQESYLAGTANLFWNVDETLPFIPMTSSLLSQVVYIRYPDVYLATPMYPPDIGDSEKIIDITNSGFGFSHYENAAVKIAADEVIFYNICNNWNNRQTVSHTIQPALFPVVSRNFMSPSGNAAFYIERDKLVFCFKTGSSWDSNMKIKKRIISPRPPTGTKIIAAELQDTEEGGAFLYYTYEDSLELYFIEVKRD